jgi:hypothetical protein
MHYFAYHSYELNIAMYLERLKRVLPTERGLHLAYSSGDSEESLELGREAADQILKALQVKQVAGEKQLTLNVLGHQVVRTPEAYGLLLRTQEFGDVVFSLPQAVLQRLITDLTQLASSPPMLRTPDSGDATGHARGNIERPYPLSESTSVRRLPPP